ncbi:glycoside hydrolase family 79 protein [Jaapia argillacea MUCL 33604]|uniref:Glycoside hydrolase family 79 protein n=1 Tax=Jaapia argillacea MUCL 33604 TaxID=933084 RepID=A0A067Q643_9AGAM|nr:glycoside hydrolase family 79 protein [Jaapia argillacea MUCL 33604]
MRTGLFLLISAVLFSLANAATPIQFTLPDKPPAVALQNVVQDNFLGISFELSSFNTIWGETPDGIPHALLNYLSNIRARISKPLRLRVGGNAMDGSTYVPAQSNMITLTNPNANINAVPVDFGPIFFDVLNKAYDGVGSMMFTIGLSMQNPANDSNVVLLAQAATQKLGNRLDAMLLGNEPDLYSGHGTTPGYTIPDYITDVKKIVTDMKTSPAGNPLNRTLLGGPTICCGWDLDQIIKGGLEDYPYKYYTLQHYPTHICAGPNAVNTNISYFLSHMNVPVFASWNIQGINDAKLANVPVLLTEYNSVSCGGSNISDTFAMSLWAVDIALQLATHNFSGAYLHTREFNVTYNLFDPPSPTSPTSPGWSTGSPYYTELVLAETISSTGSVIVDLNVNNSITSPGASVAGYGVYDKAGQKQGKVVLFNFANDGQGETFQIPKSAGITSIGYRLLVAPSVYERTNISWAGQTVGPLGELEGVQVTTYQDCGSGGCAVTVPGPGLALVYLNPKSGDSDKFFVGNSSLYGYVPPPAPSVNGTSGSGSGGLKGAAGRGCGLVDGGRMVVMGLMSVLVVFLV